MGNELGIVGGLFPRAEPPDWADIPMRTEPEDPVMPFTVEKVQRAAARLPSGKSPGTSGVINEVISAVAQHNPASLLGVLNECLTHQKFPDAWKRGRILLLYKGSPRPKMEPSSYRPISLLDGAGKVLERLLLNRIDEQVSTGFSRNQFGFRKGMGTLEAVEAMLRGATEAARGVV